MIKISIPVARTEELMVDGYHDLISLHTHLQIEAERAALRAFDADNNFPLADVIPRLASAEINRIAWSLCSVGEISKRGFDPIAFGKACEQIARQQMEEYEKTIALADAKPEGHA